MVVVTVERLLVGLVSAVVPNAAIPAVFCTVVLVVMAALAKAVTVIKQLAPGGALLKLPVICVRVPTTAVAVVHVPPPLEAAVTLKTGVMLAGSVSV